MTGSTRRSRGLPTLPSWKHDRGVPEGTTMPPIEASSYDTVPYDTQAFVESHPDTLATLAVLHGLSPAPVSTARVLELGCADGGNLVPAAVAAPGARFVGIDLSARQIQDGRALLERVGVTNVDLRVMSILEVGPELGTFDYVICHGVYSWVPPAVRAKVLEIARANLAPHGVAFVSYNVLPGWHGLGTIRGLMNFAAAESAEPAERVARARAALDQVIAGAPDPNSPYAQALRREASQLREKSDSYLLHEYMEEHNDPMYFHEFVGQLSERGLQYLTDARFRTTALARAEAMGAALDRLGGTGPIRREQAMDFLTNRTFRRSLLVRGEARPVAPTAGRMATLRVLAACAPVARSGAGASNAPEEYVLPDGSQRFSPSDPLVSSALRVLAEAWPSSVPVPELWERVAARTAGGAKASSIEALTTALWPLFLRGFVDLHSWEPAFATELGDRPKASPWARLQAERSVGRLTNLRHRVLEVSAFDRLVLRQLDGRRTRSQVIDGLVTAALDGTFPLQRDGAMLRDAMEVRGILERSLGPSLARLRGNALLMA